MGIGAGGGARGARQDSGAPARPGGALAVRALALALAIFTAGFLTLPRYGITWDEPIYMEASFRVEEWLAMGAKGLSCEAIAASWDRDLVRNVHPSGLKWMYVASRHLVPGSSPYRQARVFSLGLASLALAAFFTWATPSWGQAAGATLILLGMPRFFSHLHFAATDVPLTSVVVLCVALARLLNGRWWFLPVGLMAFGCSIKFTALLLFVPLVLVAVVRPARPWASLARLLGVAVVGAVLTVALNPNWWCNPWTSVRAFLTQSTTRLRWTPLSVFYAGTLYTGRGPWHYPFVMFGITTPLLHLAMLVGGLVRSWGHRPRWLVWALVMGSAPFVVMLLPQSPTNDGERYLLPAYPFLALLMLEGARAWWHVVRTPRTGMARWVRAASLGAGLGLLGSAAVGFVHSYPHGLSYYNELIGGLRGAYQRGFEVTYWWDPLDEGAWREVNQITAGRPVYFPLLPTDHFFRHMARAGTLRFALCYHPEEADFVCFMGRPNVAFWEVRVTRQLGGATLEPVWERTLEGIPLLRLSRVVR